MSNVVKYFNYSHVGVPPVGVAWGDMVAMLDAVLVNGFNPISITAITCTGTVATAITSAPHGNKVDQVIAITGATPSEYNGEIRITAVPTTTSFQFAVASPLAAASGTITAKTASLGFELTFTSGNKRVYRSTNPASNKPYFRIDNGQDPVYGVNYQKHARVTMAEGMTNIDTFSTGGKAPNYPTDPTRNEVGTGSGNTCVTGQYKWYQTKNYNGSNTAYDSEQYADGVTTNRQWAIIGDDRGFYFHISCMGGQPTLAAIYAFTDFKSYVPNDKYNTALIASNWYNNAGAYSTFFDCQTRMDMTRDPMGSIIHMRDYTQVGNYCTSSLFCLNPINSQIISGVTATVPYPNGSDFSLAMFPLYLKEDVSLVMRGKLPGIHFIPHNIVNSYPAYTILDSVTGFSGRKFVILSGGYAPDNTNVYQTRVAYDITGPWDR